MKKPLLALKSAAFGASAYAAIEAVAKTATVASARDKNFFMISIHRSFVSDAFSSFANFCNFDVNQFMADRTCETYGKQV